MDAPPACPPGATDVVSPAAMLARTAPSETLRRPAGAGANRLPAGRAGSARAGPLPGAGLFGMLVAPFVSRLLPFFPLVVTGSIITVIGITLMRIGIN